MDQNLKAAWLADLRSGKHQQISGALREGNGFCCLGRLCDVAGATWTLQGPSSLYSCEYGETFFETQEALDKLGISKEIMRVAFSMNDGISLGGPKIELPNFEPRIHSFEEIADWLERQGDLTGKPVP